MDFSAQLDALKQHAADAQKSAAAAMKESHLKLRGRLDQAQVDADLAAKDMRDTATESAKQARNQWAKLKADTSAKMADVRHRVEKREAEHDAKVAAHDAEWAEADAAEAIDYATWAADNARLAVLDALDARKYADELAAAAKG
jgi:hypothetical protein